jgi:hypothetical protein
LDVTLVRRKTRDFSHIPKHVASTVRIAIVEGSIVSTGLPAETGIAIPSPQNAIATTLDPQPFHPANPKHASLFRIAATVAALKVESGQVSTTVSR